uniref:CSON012523 protein n=1 Tax=Culicoides sonorensis TaxID=179676 RepID=A0A336K7D3_CULSO
MFCTRATVNEPQKCSFPGAPAHSTVTFTDETLDNGAVAQYSCERGFELLGPSRRVCDHGSWVPEGVPFCELENKIKMNRYEIGLNLNTKYLNIKKKSFPIKRTISSDIFSGFEKEN